MLAAVRREAGGGGVDYLALPRTEGDALGVTVFHRARRWWWKFDEYESDPATGALRPAVHGPGAPLLNKVNGVVGTLHFGHQGGAFMRGLGLVGGAAPAWLALGGAWLWWRRGRAGRRNPRRRKRKGAPAGAAGRTHLGRVKNRRRFSLLLLAALALAPAAPAQPSAGLPKKIVVALKPDKNPDQMLAEKRALEQYLSGKLGVPAEVIIPLSAAVILEGFANGTIDLGYLSATDMVRARKAGAADLLLAGELNGKTSYQSYWLALKDKPYAAVQDLRGKPVAFASRTSTSGYVIPLWNLREQGLIGTAGTAEDFFGQGNVWFGSGYVSAVERVLAGEVEAAAVSYYVLDLDKHLGAEQRAKLKKVAEQGPVPTHVIAVRASLGEVEKGLLLAALNGLNAPPHQELRDKLFTSKLIAVDADRHLASLTEALRFAEQAQTR